MDFISVVSLFGGTGLAVWVLYTLGKNHARDSAAYKTEALVSEANALREKLPNQTQEQFLNDVIDEMHFRHDGKLPLRSLALQMKETIRTLYLFGNVAKEIETPNVLDGIEGARARDKLRARMEQLTPANVQLVKEAVARSMEAYCDCLPEHLFADLEDKTQQAGLSFTTNIIDILRSPGQCVQNVGSFFFDHKLEENGLFNTLRYVLTRNIYAMSDKRMDEKNPKLIRASEHKGTPREIVQGYLRDTWLDDLFIAPVPFTIPQVVRFEHHWLVSPTGTGKSTTLIGMILKDLDAVARGEASVIVMESNRDLVKGIERLKRFAPGGDLSGKLVVIDVEDVEYPVAINLFDIGLEQINNASPRDKEALLNSAVSMLDYVFRALLGAELTSRQSTLFNFTIQLLIHTKGATLDTFIDLMQPDAMRKPEYQEALELLDADARMFFDMKFDSKELAKTKTEVTDRLFAVKRVRSLSRMFSAEKTKLDLFREMGEGKVILINLASSLLGADGVEILGRFFLAMALLAAEKRQVLAKDERKSTFFYIDEAHGVLKRDEKIATILDECRKYRLAMIIAHQRVEQLTPPVINALMGSTAIKFAAQVSDSNAAALARNMGTVPEFILHQPKYHYAVSVRGLTTSAVSLQIPFVDLNTLPRMSAEEAQRVRADMRRRFAINPNEQPPAQMTEEDLFGGTLKVEEPEIEEVEAEYVAPDKPTPRPPRERPAPRDVEVEVIRIGPPQKRLTKGYSPPQDDKPKEW